jgi:LuxR family maltose regulon positive regulatory protein
MGAAALFMTLAGRLHEAYQLVQQLLPLGTQPGGFMLPDVGWLIIWQAVILCEWNQLDAARSLIEEAIPICKQAESTPASMYVVSGYAILAHICLARGELEEARSALLQVERVGQNMNQPLYLHYRSFYTTIDQVRFWLACGRLDHAMQWAKELDLAVKRGTPLAREHEEVARARIFLATHQPAAALQRLELVLERATVGQRWSDVIEIRLLQALAHQMCYEETQALSILSEAVRLAEPEGYIRRFVDEGAPMAALLSQLREQRREVGPTPYLDTLLAAFPQQRKARKRQPKQAMQRTIAQLQPK